MEFQQLRYFLAIVQAGSFTAAAKACRVSQPALSVQVAKLEAELGGPLFERGRKGARLSQRGESFRPRAAEALRQLEQGRQELEEIGGLRAGKVSLGCLPTTGAFVLPRLLKAFKKSFPVVQVDLKEDSSPALRSRLLEGEVDVAIVDEAGLDGRLHSDLLFRERLLAALPAGHPLAGRRTLSLRSLAGDPWVMMKPGRGFRTIVEDGLRAAGVKPRIMFESDEIFTVLALVEAGLGVTLAPRMVRKGGAAYVELGGAGLTRGLYVAVRSVQGLAPSAAQMRRKILDLGADLGS